MRSFIIVLASVCVSNPIPFRCRFSRKTVLDQKSDFVVLAAPFEKLNIEFENVEFYQTIEPRDFVFCYVTHVEATGVSPAYFGEPTVVEMPDSILTTPDSTLPFTIIGIGKFIFSLVFSRKHRFLIDVQRTCQRTYPALKSTRSSRTKM